MNQDDNCDQPHPADIENCSTERYPIGFAAGKEYVSSTIVSGKPVKAKGYGHGSSEVSQAEADEQALERAKEHAARLLGLKINVRCYLADLCIRSMNPPTKGIIPRVAPLSNLVNERAWEGLDKKRASEYRVTAFIPHLNTIESLLMAVELLRAQTERPFIIIGDTGSPREVCNMLEVLREDSEDLDIHYIRASSYQHSSEPVTAAMDLAQSICQTEYMFHTHSDCFLRRFDFLESLMQICDQSRPVVGYRMSPRDWVTKEWEFMVGHTATLLHMPTIHKLGATWSMSRMHHEFGYGFESKGGWPDTEICFNRILKREGVKPIFIGHDTNYERYKDSNIDHCRSHAGSRVYAQQYFEAKASKWIKGAIRDGQARIKKGQEIARSFVNES